MTMAASAPLQCGGRKARQKQMGRKSGADGGVTAVSLAAAARTGEAGCAEAEGKTMRAADVDACRACRVSDAEGRGRGRSVGNRARGDNLVRADEAAVPLRRPSPALCGTRRAPKARKVGWAAPPCCARAAWMAGRQRGAKGSGRAVGKGREEKRKRGSRAGHFSTVVFFGGGALGVFCVAAREKHTAW